jgi:hypothetical protein
MPLVGSASPIETLPLNSGAATHMPLQRAPAGTPAAAATETTAVEAAEPTGGPPSMPTAGAGLESLDLERVADEVYTIIERRLTIERESLGL